MKDKVGKFLAKHCLKIRFALWIICGVLSMMNGWHSGLVPIFIFFCVWAALIIELIEKIVDEAEKEKDNGEDVA